MDQYADMIDLPRHVSEHRAHMSMIDRGAQFSPFAALTGYEAVIAESARLTEQDITLTEGAIADLDGILRELRDRIQERPFARYTCFIPDERKAGGACVEISGNLKKYDSVEKKLILVDGTQVEIDQILSIRTE